MSALAKLDASPLTKTSLAESVYETLAEAILTGTLAGGSELSEVAVAAKLGVSRTPVHEAFRRLIHDGLIKLLPNRVAQVAKFTPKDVAEVYEMRAILEPAAVLRRQVAGRRRTRGPACGDRILECDDERCGLGGASPGVRCSLPRLPGRGVRQQPTTLRGRQVSSPGARVLQAERHHGQPEARPARALDHFSPPWKRATANCAAQAMCDHINARLEAILHELPA